MKHKLHFLMAVLVVGGSFFAFQNLDSKDSSVPTALKTPSMIPGAEAMRPLAAQQSGRVDALIAEMNAEQTAGAPAALPVSE